MNMNEKTLLFMAGATIFLIGLILVMNDILALLGVDVKDRLAPIKAFSWLLFIFATATGAAFVGEALKMRDED